MKKYLYTRGDIMLGNTDRPIEIIKDDTLKVEKYIVGLSNFIRKCDTPMTIAIQGDWGSGKTSFMYMIKNNMGDEMMTAWVNTWQFSQFNLGDSLTVLFLTALIESLKDDTDNHKNLKNSVRMIGKMVYNVGVQGVSKLSGIDIEGVTKDIEEPENIIKTVEELKNQFQTSVKETLKKNGKSRFVIFVDDLDRLAPYRAVEILEVLKLFLDCEQCIFVLAIDYKVVSQGVRQKYGDSIDDDKGRNFFDKIIQVPFKIPIAHYSISSYIEEILNKLDCATDNLDVYERLISDSIGYNPRGIKRIFNAFSLLKEVYLDLDWESSFNQSLLFAALCLQLSYEDIYNYIVRNENNDVDDSFFKAFSSQNEGDDERALEIIDELCMIKQKDDIISFMNTFCDTFLVDADNNIDDSKLEMLNKILNIAGTMSKSNIESVADNGKVGKGIRYTNVYDEEYSWYSIYEGIEKVKPGWNGSKIDAYELYGTPYKVRTLSEAVVNILSEFHKRDQKRFEEIKSKDKVDQYRLYSLFYGSKQKGIVAPQNIPDTDIQIEGKNSYDQKVQFLRNIMEAMKASDANLKLHLRLAHRIQLED